MYPKELKYTETHEWISVDGDTATVGITMYAKDQLEEVTLVEFPDEETIEVEQNEETGIVLESHKNVSDINSPASGTIIAFNKELEDNPDVLNANPYQEGWLYKMTLSDPDELEDLLDAEAYEQHVKEEMED